MKEAYWVKTENCSTVSRIRILKIFGTTSSELILYLKKNGTIFLCQTFTDCCQKRRRRYPVANKALFYIFSHVAAIKCVMSSYFSWNNNMSVSQHLMLFNALLFIEYWFMISPNHCTIFPINIVSQAFGNWGCIPSCSHNLLKSVPASKKGFRLPFETRERRCQGPL